LEGSLREQGWIGGYVEEISAIQVRAGRGMTLKQKY
jgi:hypothetical protein